MRRRSSAASRSTTAKSAKQESRPVGKKSESRSRTKTRQKKKAQEDEEEEWERTSGDGDGTQSAGEPEARHRDKTSEEDELNLPPLDPFAVNDIILSLEPHFSRPIYPPIPPDFQSPDVWQSFSSGVSRSSGGETTTQNEVGASDVTEGRSDEDPERGSHVADNTRRKPLIPELESWDSLWPPAMLGSSHRREGSEPVLEGPSRGGRAREQGTEGSNTGEHSTVTSGGEGDRLTCLPAMPAPAEWEEEDWVDAKFSLYRKSSMQENARAMDRVRFLRTRIWDAMDAADGASLAVDGVSCDKASGDLPEGCVSLPSPFDVKLKKSLANLPSHLPPPTELLPAPPERCLNKKIVSQAVKNSVVTVLAAFGFDDASSAAVDLFAECTCAFLARACKAVAQHAEVKAPPSLISRGLLGAPSTLPALSTSLSAPPSAFSGMPSTRPPGTATTTQAGLSGVSPAVVTASSAAASSPPPVTPKMEQGVQEITGDKGETDPSPIATGERSADAVAEDKCSAEEKAGKQDRKENVESCTEPLAFAIRGLESLGPTMSPAGLLAHVRSDIQDTRTHLALAEQQLSSLLWGVSSPRGYYEAIATQLCVKKERALRAKRERKVAREAGEGAKIRQLQASALQRASSLLKRQQQQLQQQQQQRAQANASASGNATTNATTTSGARPASSSQAPNTPTNPGNSNTNANTNTTTSTNTNANASANANTGTSTGQHVGSASPPTVSASSRRSVMGVGGVVGVVGPTNGNGGVHLGQRTHSPHSPHPQGTLPPSLARSGVLPQQATHSHVPPPSSPHNHPHTHPPSSPHKAPATHAAGQVMHAASPHPHAAAAGVHTQGMHGATGGTAATYDPSYAHATARTSAVQSRSSYPTGVSYTGTLPLRVGLSLPVNTSSSSVGTSSASSPSVATTPTSATQGSLSQVSAPQLWMQGGIPVGASYAVAPAQSPQSTQSTSVGVSQGTAQHVSSLSAGSLASHATARGAQSSLQLGAGGAIVAGPATIPSAAAPPSPSPNAVSTPPSAVLAASGSLGADAGTGSAPHTPQLQLAQHLQAHSQSPVQSIAHSPSYITNSAANGVGVATSVGSGGADAGNYGSTVIDLVSPSPTSASIDPSAATMTLQMHNGGAVGGEPDAKRQRTA
eukprot:Rmarinus@m.11488